MIGVGRVALGLGLVALSACRGRALVGASEPDASVDAGDAASAPPTSAVRAFDVTATLTVEPPPWQEGGWSDFPKAHAFTLVLDGDRLWVGSAGSFSSARASRAPDGTISATATVAVPFDRSCTRTATIRFDELSFMAGDGLTGVAKGTASFQSGADVQTAKVTASLFGKLDETPPSVAVPAEVVDPLEPLSFPVSEPLPSTASAKLVSQASGQSIPLVPQRLEGDAIGAFTKPDVMLVAGETYALQADGFTDFASHAGATSGATFKTRAAPPLALQDGFESLTGDTFGGAGVLADGPLTAITGQKSLLLNTGFGGGFGFLPYSLGSSLSVRLTIPAGASVVRFARRLVAPDATDTAMYVGAVRLASVGHQVETTMNLPATDFAKETLPGNGDVYVSPVKTIDLPLPPGAAGELTFEIVGVTFQCGLPPVPTVLVLDDLRVE